MDLSTLTKWEGGLFLVMEIVVSCHWPLIFEKVVQGGTGKSSEKINRGAGVGSRWEVGFTNRQIWPSFSSSVGTWKRDQPQKLKIKCIQKNGKALEVIRSGTNCDPGSRDRKEQWQTFCISSSQIRILISEQTFHPQRNLKISWHPVSHIWI